MNVSTTLQRLNERIYEACRRSGRKTEDIRLMAVTKFHNAELVREAFDAGLRLFGENRVQEAEGKFPSFLETHSEAELHLIGSLQRNKTKRALSLFKCIQSLDRIELVDELVTLAGNREVPLDIFFELHTGEESKAGFPDLDTLYPAVEKVLSCGGLNICGLMTMAPFTTDQNPIRASFRTLSAAQTRLKQRFPEADWSCLSMGMSNDFEIAVEEGSTLLRIGTALFGGRT